jgi:YbbR domain-containing protein
MTRNLSLKLIALLLALVIWFYVQSGDQITDKLMTIPLVVEGLPEGLAVATIIPDQVELYIRGPQSRVKSIEETNDEGNLKAKLNLKRATEGRKFYSIRVTGTNLRWMYFTVHPGPKLEIECEESSQKIFTPERYLIGDLAPGMFIESESGLPESVAVEGAETLVNKVTRVIYRLTEADLLGSDVINASFIPQDNLGRQIPNLGVNPPKAALSITVRKTSAPHEVPITYNIVGYPPAGYTVTDIRIEPLFVTLEGSPELLRDITRIETVPVDLTGRTKDFSIPDLELANPNEKLKLDRNTIYFEAKITQKTSKRLFEGLTLHWDGGNDQFLHYSSEPWTVNVTVTGPLDSVENLTRDMIIPSVDVSDLTEGWHEDKPVSVRILLPSISLVKIEPNTVKVHVQKREEFLLEEEKEE